jgi:hypothetical protein
MPSAIRRTAQHHRGGSSGTFVPPAVPATHRLKYQWLPGTAFDSAEWTIGTGAGNAGNGRRVSSAVTFNAIDPLTSAQVIRVRAQATQDPDLSWHLDSGILFRKGATRAVRNSVRVISIRATEDPTLTMSPVVLAWPASGVWPVNGEDDFVEVGGGQSTSTPPGFRRPGGYDHWSVDGVTSGTTANRQSHYDYGTALTNYADYHTYYSEHDGQVHKHHIDAFPASGANLITLNNNLFHPTGVAQYSSIQNDATANEANSRFGGNFNSTTFAGCDMLVRYYAEWLPKTYVLGPTLPASGVVALTPGYSLEPLGTVDAVPAVTASINNVGIQPDSAGKAMFIIPWETDAATPYYAAIQVRFVSPLATNVTRSVSIRISSDNTSMVRAQFGADSRIRIYKFVSGALTELTTITAGQFNTRYDPGTLAHGDFVMFSLTAEANGSVTLRAVTTNGGVALPSIDALQATAPVMTIPASSIADSAIPVGGDVGFMVDASGNASYATGATIRNVWAGDVTVTSVSATAGASNLVTLSGLTNGTTYDVYHEAANATNGTAGNPSFSTIDSATLTPTSAVQGSTLYYPNWQSHSLGALNAAQIDYSGGLHGANTSSGAERNTWQNGPGTAVDNTTTDGNGTSGNRQSIVNDPAGVLLNGVTRKVLQIGPVLETDNKLTGNPRSQWEGPAFIDGTQPGGYEVYFGVEYWFPATTDANPMPTVPYGQWLNIGEVWGSPFTNACPMALMVTQLEQQSSPEYLKGIIQGGFTPRIPELFILPATRQVWHSLVWHLNVSNDDTDPRDGFVEIFYNGGSGWSKLKLFNGLKRYNYFNFNPNGDQEPNKPHVLNYRSAGWATGGLTLHVGHWKVATTFQLAASPTYGTPPVLEPV